MISLFILPFPVIDPIAFEIGPVAIRWYALAYITGFLLGWRYTHWLAARMPKPIKTQDIDDFLTWAMLGVILGGRLGYVLFYNFSFYASHPLEIIQIWHGGMSFHGGLLGMALVILVFCYRRGIAPLAMGDIISCAVPIGLFFGRLANFINGELYGRPSTVPWAMVFPQGGSISRHPSQLYEAFLEGIVLFVILGILAYRRTLFSWPGSLFGMFLIGYGFARTFAEVFRDEQFMSFYIVDLTKGQLLSLPMILVGLVIIWWSTRSQRL